MAVRVLWIRNGFVEAAEALNIAGQSNVDDLPFFDQGLVRITSGSLGTEIKCSFHTPCYASLIATIEMLVEFHSPFILRCFFGGCLRSAFQTL